VFSDNDNIKYASGLPTDVHNEILFQHILNAANFISRKYIGCQNNKETKQAFINVDKYTALEYIKKGLAIYVGTEDVL